MEKELLRVVLEDLDYLTKEWNQDIDDASLRRASPALRSLLVEGTLLAVARQIGKEVRVLSPAIYQVLTDDQLRLRKYWQSGGAKYKGVIVQAMGVRNSALSPDEVKAEYEQTKDVMGKNYPVKLAFFLRQPSFVIEGIFINREEVIKYVANKLGGAHYDNSRKPKTSAPGVSLEEKYALLDSARNSTMLADKNAIYYELLSIGQRLVNSKDVQELRKTLRDMLK